MNKMNKEDLEKMIFLYKQQKFHELKEFSKIILKQHPSESIILIFLGLSFSTLFIITKLRYLLL